MLNSLHLQKLRIPHSRDVIHVLGYYLKYIVGSFRFFLNDNNDDKCYYG